MAGQSGFAVSISAVDRASGTIDGINRRLAAMTAPSDRLAKSLVKLGDTSGVNRLAEGTQLLGSRALDAFRSVDRVGAAMSGLTGAASIAGMGALVNRWAQLGQQTANVGQRLGVPTDQLTALQGAARLAGASAEDVSSGLTSLDEHLRGAAFNRDPMSAQIFERLHVGIRNADGSARNAADSFGDVAQGIADFYNSGPTGRGQALRFAQSLGIESLFPLLVKGRQGVADLRAEAAKLGGVISPEMANRGLHESFEKLSIALEGVENRLGDNWGKAVKPYIDGTADWISKNKDVAGSYATIGAGILALGSIKPAAWLARMLGIGAVAPYAPLLAPLAIPGDTDNTATPDGFIPGWKPDMGAPGAPYLGKTETFGGMLHREWNTWAPSWLGGGNTAKLGESLTRGGKIGLPPTASPANAMMMEGYDYYTSRGLTSAQAAGMLAQEAGESSFNPENVTGDQHFLYQWRGPRLSRLEARYGDHPTAEQQREYALWELQNDPTYRPAYDALLASRTSRDAALAAVGFERPEGWHSLADPGVHGIERADVAPAIEQRVSGHVAVDVTLRNAPPGTTATTTTSGPIRARPLMVVPAMPGY